MKLFSLSLLIVAFLALSACVWKKTAAELFELGEKYYTGNGVPRDQGKAEGYFRQAADKGNAEAQYTLIICYGAYGFTFPAEDYEENVEQYLKAAEQGDTLAQSHLGNRYLDRYLWSQNVDEGKEAVIWLRKAAEQGYATAQHNLGLCYVKGFAVERDTKEALKWLHKATDQGYMMAQYNLGCLYQLGDGVEKDTKEALTWFRKAADQGYSEAQRNLGYRYQLGIGVEKDATEAAKWFQKAADRGDNDAARALWKLRQ